MGKYIDLTKNNFDSEIKEGVTMVDFWAEWCGPCRALAPVIDELANDFEGKAKICKVNIDNENEIAAKYGIKSIPTILFFKDGELYDTKTGADTKTFFTNKINEKL